MIKLLVQKAMKQQPKQERSSKSLLESLMAEPAERKPRLLEQNRVSSLKSDLQLNPLVFNFHDSVYQIQKPSCSFDNPDQKQLDLHLSLPFFRIRRHNNHSERTYYQRRGFSKEDAIMQSVYRSSSKNSGLQQYNHRINRYAKLQNQKVEFIDGKKQGQVLFFERKPAINKQRKAQRKVIKLGLEGCIIDRSYAVNHMKIKKKGRKIAQCSINNSYSQTKPKIQTPEKQLPQNQENQVTIPNIIEQVCFEQQDEDYKSKPLCYQPVPALQTNRFLPQGFARFHDFQREQYEVFQDRLMQEFRDRMLVREQILIRKKQLSKIRKFPRPPSPLNPQKINQILQERFQKLMCQRQQKLQERTRASRRKQVIAKRKQTKQPQKIENDQFDQNQSRLASDSSSEQSHQNQKPPLLIFKINYFPQHITQKQPSPQPFSKIQVRQNKDLNKQKFRKLSRKHLKIKFQTNQIKPCKPKRNKEESSQSNFQNNKFSESSKNEGDKDSVSCLDQDEKSSLTQNQINNTIQEQAAIPQLNTYASINQKRSHSSSKILPTKIYQFSTNMYQKSQNAQILQKLVYKDGRKQSAVRQSHEIMHQFNTKLQDHFSKHNSQIKLRSILQTGFTLFQDNATYNLSPRPTQFRNFLDALKILLDKSFFFIYRLFDKKTISKEFLGIWLCWRGDWRKVHVDDQILVNSKGKSVFVYSNVSLWPAFLQKAIYKVLPSFEQFQNLTLSDFIQILTGSPTVIFKLRQNPTRNTKAFNYIQDGLRKNHLVVGQCYSYLQMQGKQWSPQSLLIVKDFVEKNQSGSQLKRIHIQIESGICNFQQLNLRKFSQLVQNLVGLQLRANNFMNSISIGLQTEDVNVVRLVFSQGCQGSITYYSKHSTPAKINMALYYQLQKDCFKQIGSKTSKKQKSSFTSQFKSGKYLIFIESLASSIPVYDINLMYFGQQKVELILEEKLQKGLTSHQNLYVTAQKLTKPQKEGLSNRTQKFLESCSKIQEDSAFTF